MAIITTRKWGMPARLAPLFPLPTTRAFEEMENRLQQLVKEPFGTALLPEPLGYVPPIEMTESPTEFLVTAELPGLQAKDVEVAFEGDVLTIRGEKVETYKEEQNGRRYHLYERIYGAFARSFAFPTPVNMEKIAAEFVNGVLTVHVPKAAEEKVRGKKIPVAETKLVEPKIPETKVAEPKLAEKKIEPKMAEAKK